MKRKYKIGHYKSVNEWIIYREYDGMVQYLGSGMIWVNNKSHAKRFLHEQDAVSTLSIVKVSKRIRTEDEYIKENEAKNKEKQTWNDYN